MQHVTTISPTSGSDKEYSGSLNRALSGSATDFALLVSMLQQNLLERPRVVTPEAQTADEVPQHHYRRMPLQVPEFGWNTLHEASQLLHKQQFMSMRLWQSMHPEGLTLKDDVAKIPPEVIANMDIAAQRRQQLGATALGRNALIEPQPAALYDVLTQLENSAA